MNRLIVFSHRYGLPPYYKNSGNWVFPDDVKKDSDGYFKF